MISNWASTTFRALGNPGYRVLWTGSTLAFLAFAMMSVVQSVVAYDLTGKNGSVGAVALGMGIAQLTIAPFGGVLADRLPKRRLVLIGQSILGMTFLSVGILITTGTSRSSGSRVRPSSWERSFRSSAQRARRGLARYSPAREWPTASRFSSWR